MVTFLHIVHIVSSVLMGFLIQQGSYSLIEKWEENKSFAIVLSLILSFIIIFGVFLLQ